VASDLNNHIEPTVCLTASKCPGTRILFAATRRLSTLQLAHNRQYALSVTRAEVAHMCRYGWVVGALRHGGDLLLALGVVSHLLTITISASSASQMNRRMTLVTLIPEPYSRIGAEHVGQDSTSLSSAIGSGSSPLGSYLRMIVRMWASRPKSTSIPTARSPGAARRSRPEK